MLKLDYFHLVKMCWDRDPFLSVTFVPIQSIVVVQPVKTLIFNIFSLNLQPWLSCSLCVVKTTMYGKVSLYEYCVYSRQILYMLFTELENSNTNELLPIKMTSISSCLISKEMINELLFLKELSYIALFF